MDLGEAPGRDAAEALLAFDRAHVWHPYGSATAPSAVRLVESAAGTRLRLHGHGEVIDAMASWWCAIHGYRHPVLDAAAAAQLATMAHVMFGGLTHEPAVRLARQLVDLSGYEHVFFCDSGSVSVEVAVKMSLQYQRGRGRRSRHRLATIRGGYHGDTFAAMSVCDPVGGMHQLFTGVLPSQLFLPQPPPGFERGSDDPDVAAWATAVAALVERHADELAAIVVEPVLQGAGGMFVYSPACLRVLRDLADRFELLLVFDEIATAFGRTGTMFAAHHAGVVPDIMCVGKALTGGYLTLAAVLCGRDVAEGVDASEAGGLMHGPTFMANPLACAVASASVELLVGSPWQDRVARIAAVLRDGLAPAAALPGVRDVRVLGAVGVVQTTAPVDVPRVTQAALRHGVWVRPFRDLVYTMPPYVCTDDEVRTIAGAIVAAVQEAA